MPIPRSPAPHALALQEEIVIALEKELRGKVLVILLDQIEAAPADYAPAFSPPCARCSSIAGCVRPCKMSFLCWRGVLFPMN